MEFTPKTYRSFREALTGEEVFHTESRPVGPSPTTPEKVLDAMEMFGREAAKLAIKSCFGENNAEAEAALNSRFFGQTRSAIEAA